MTEVVYSVNSSRLNKSIMQGLDYRGGVSMTLEKGTDYHMLLLSPIDSGVEDATWGRLKFSFKSGDDMIVYTRILTTNHLIEESELQTVLDLKHMGARQYVNNQDILLYDITGRYLYIAIEIVGEGDGILSDIRIDRIGDNFLRIFPEIYRERGSFFHRYLSVFSSIYNDFNELLEHLYRILDLDHASEQFLIYFGQWLGIDLDCDIKDINILRTFVKEAYELNKYKGTKEAVRRIAKILLNEEVTILEKNIMEQYEDEEELEAFKELFGHSVYNVCILVDEPISEVTKSQFMYILSQYIPVRARIQIVNLKRKNELDFHSYLDMNARLFESRDGVLDSEMPMDHAITLQE